MLVTSFVIGFFTAFGWWSATKITNHIDKNILIEQKEEICQTKI